MASTLRLPPELDADARERCRRLGISLNALVCVALDAYLRQPGEPESLKITPADPLPSTQISRKERRRLEAIQREKSR